MLAMVVNDNVAILTPCCVHGFIASMLAPTVKAVRQFPGFAPIIQTSPLAFARS